MTEVARGLEEQLIQAMSSANPKAASGDSQHLATLEQRERFMNAEVEKLQAENEELRKKLMATNPSIDDGEASGVGKKKRFICC